MRTPPRRLPLALTALAIPSLAFAYIDAGTGAYLVQSIMAFVGILAFYVTRPIRYLKHLLRRSTKSETSETDS